MKIAILQMCAGIDPDTNAREVEAQARAAANAGATCLFTPEMTNCVDKNRDRIFQTVREEEQDPSLACFQALAEETGLWLSIGSIAIKLPGGDKLANRSYLINPAGVVVARYDKIHLFDIALGDGEAYYESRTYKGGETAVVAPSPLGPMGLSICYDIRFPMLYEAMAASGARAILIPSAFTVKTGQAHWHTLVRARAIETLSFVIAAAQTGRHADGRATYGHSLVVSPWGEVLLDAGDQPGLYLADIDLDAVTHARKTMASLGHRQAFAVEKM